jgi:hypothetical protein
MDISPAAKLAIPNKTNTVKPFPGWKSSRNPPLALAAASALNHRYRTIATEIGAELEQIKKNQDLLETVTFEGHPS